MGSQAATPDLEQQVERLPTSCETTVEDLRGALARQGISEKSIRPGDALLSRHGWASLWSDPARHDESPAGIGVAAARWVVERKLTMIGVDTSAGELSPNPGPELVLPLHQEPMNREGVFMPEDLDLDALAAGGVHEFLFALDARSLRGSDRFARRAVRHPPGVPELRLQCYLTNKSPYGGRAPCADKASARAFASSLASS